MIPWEQIFRVPCSRPPRKVFISGAGEIGGREHVGVPAPKAWPPEPVERLTEDENRSRLVWPWHPKRGGEGDGR